jgi:hypothetical protein
LIAGGNSTVAPLIQHNPDRKKVPDDKAVKMMPTK